jgi:NCS1 family nucleobase:cation symporter-1
MPFVATGFYTGPWVDALGGVDVSWIVGIVVPGVLYYAVSRLARSPVPARLIVPGPMTETD